MCFCLFLYPVVCLFIHSFTSNFVLVLMNAEFLDEKEREKSALMEEADTELSRLAQSQSYFGLLLWLIVVAVVSMVVVRW